MVTALSCAVRWSPPYSIPQLQYSWSSTSIAVPTDGDFCGPRLQRRIIRWRRALPRCGKCSLSSVCRRCFHHQCFVNIHTFLSFPLNTLRVFWREKRSAAQQIHNPSQRKQPRSPHSHPRKDLTNKTKSLKNFTTHLRPGQTIHTDSCAAGLKPFLFLPPPLFFHFFSLTGRSVQGEVCRDVPTDHEARCRPVAVGTMVQVSTWTSEPLVE